MIIHEHASRFAMTGFVMELIELNFVCVRRAGGGGTGGWGGNGRSSTAAHLVESQKVSLLLSHSAGSTIRFSFILNKISANWLSLSSET